MLQAFRHYWAAFGRPCRGTCRRLQSSPASRASNWASESRITPSVIGGQRNEPFSAASRSARDRFRPRREASLCQPASCGKQKPCPRTDPVAAPPALSPPDHRHHAGNPPAASQPEPGCWTAGQSSEPLQRLQNSRQHHRIGALAHPDHSPPIGNLDPVRDRTRRPLRHDRRKRHP